MQKLLGIAIGDTMCTVLTGAYADASCKILAQTAFDTAGFSSPQEAMDTFFAAAGEQDFAAVGICSGNLQNNQNTVVLSHPNLSGWNAAHITDFFTTRYEVPCAMMNHANACAVAEWKLGNGQGLNNLIFLSFGAGMHAGLILNGQPYVGATGIAGAIGHVRLAQNGPVGQGKMGSFEGFCSEDGIAQLAQAMVRAEMQMGKSPQFCARMDELAGITARTVAIAAADGDTLAKNVLRECGRYLGRGLAVLMDILNPQAIIIGNIFERNGGLLSEAMYQAIAQEALEQTANVCSIMPARFGNMLDDYAPLAVAIRALDME